MEFNYLQDLSITQNIWGHTGRSWRKRERERTWPGVLLLLGLMVGAKGFTGSQLVNLKLDSEFLNHGKKKTEYPKWSTIEIDQDL